MKVMQVPEARPGSIEAGLHKKNMAYGYILFANENDRLYNTDIHHRAIGVVYDPAMEKFGNYVPSVLSRRYDALIYFDQTQALHPLHLHADRHKLPATYPFNV
jgi:erythromycin esterase